jgi:DNA-binding response OmpR family regulator
VTVEAKRKILLVEDEQDIRELVRYNLEAEGFTVWRRAMARSRSSLRP